jgi:hypothetical protein
VSAVPLDRDHPRKRALADDPNPRLEQFRCDMCGQFFLLRASFERHKTEEIPAFVVWAEAQQKAWEQTRRGWRKHAS